MSAPETPWLDWLRKHIGEVEWTGRMSTPFVHMIFSHTTFGDPGTTPACCAATLCAALELTGFRSPHRADAISFRNYGTACELKPGAIVVFEWRPGEYHVSVCDHIPDESRVSCTGGNQQHYLQTITYPREYILTVRWPVKA